jgi:beta-N-acetylhexosaminidase
MNVDTIADRTLARMTLDEKIGQCLTVSWRGSLVTPSVVEAITRLNVGGLRVEPYSTESARSGYYGQGNKAKGFRKPKGYFKIAETHFRSAYPGFCISAEEYARRLNRLKEIAMDRHSGVPLHVTTDFEGDFSHDFPFDGINLFPANMGIRAAGGPALAYKVGRAMGRQLSSIGIHMVHSPVCDVNINPSNPEINIRAFSDDPTVFSRYAVQMMKGIEDGGVIAVAKHFPGRGDSAIDAHDELPVLRTTRARMNRVELAPYRALIRAGLRGVMSAHNAYPALDADDIPATVSSRILTDVLRGELGFDGVITTDAMGMGAIARRWGIPAASAMAIKAGACLVLLKFDGELREQTFFEIKRWIQTGRLTEEELDDRVLRVLRMKARQGLFKSGGVVKPEAAGKTLRDPEIHTLSRDVAKRCVSVLRDRSKQLPLKKSQKVLILEQVIREDFIPGDMHYHAHSFNEAMLGHSLNVINADCHFRALPEERREILALLKDADAVVMTNWFWRVWPENNTPLVEAIARTGKPLVVVTNNPYAMGATPKAGTVVCTYGVTPQSLQAAAAVIYGRAKARGKWPLEHARPAR